MSLDEARGGELVQSGAIPCSMISDITLYFYIPTHVPLLTVTIFPAIPFLTLTILATLPLPTSALLLHDVLHWPEILLPQVH